ncbi:MAG TPA: peptidoglycan-binding protein [Trebonia sp.]|nr:peptidoglycan-binding protein [Trebonia sp.]
MGNISRKAALGIAAFLTAVTAATAVAGTAGAAPAKTMAPASGAVSAALVATAAPTALLAPAAPGMAKAPVAPAAASWPSPRLYWPRVQLGDRSVKVVNLQCLLRQWLRVWLPCNTRFTPITARYVRMFQWRHGLYPSGVVDQRTWPRLIIRVGYGSRYNLAVLAAQASLRMAYRYPITIDGVFGPQTLAAVKDFQRKYGLRPTGVVGLLTWNKLVRFEW